jgi:hypothetical protein
MFGRSVLLLCCSLSATAIAGGQEVHAIKLKQPAAGQSYQVEKSEERTATILPPGVKSEKSTTFVNQVYRETVLETTPGTGTPVSVKRHYTKAEQISDGFTLKLKYDNKTLFVRKKDDQYVFQIEGGAELTGKDAEYLKEGYEKGGPGLHIIQGWLLPSQPVKVNQAWKPDLKPLLQFVEKANNMELDSDTCTGTGTLKSVYPKGGRQFGVIAMHLELVPKTFTIQNGKKVTAPPGNKVTLDWKTNGCIDGSSLETTMEIDLQVQAVLPIDAKDVIMMKLTNHATTKITEIQSK